MIDKVPVFTKGKIELTKKQTLPIAKVREIKSLLNNNVPVKVIALDYNQSLCQTLHDVTSDEFEISELGIRNKVSADPLHAF